MRGYLLAVSKVQMLLRLDACAGKVKWGRLLISNGIAWSRGGRAGRSKLLGRRDRKAGLL
ncbi:hypothetical protein LINPERPRIM_LOCUS11708 [Linum perenne]